MVVLQDQTQKAGNIVLHCFDPVVVRLTLDSTNIQHEKFVLQLVQPYIEGFSIIPMDESEVNEKKRKTNEKEKNKKKGRKK